MKAPRLLAILVVLLVAAGGAVALANRPPEGTVAPSFLMRAKLGQLLPAKGTIASLPDLSRVKTWLNGDPGTAARLKGRAVLVQFWSYGCVECLRTLPYTKAWFDKYRGNGLTVVGVHTPESALENDRDGVERTIADYLIRYPVALDQDFAVWKAFDNRYWPTTYLFDKEGKLVYRRVGEGGYAETEAAIQHLLGVNAPDAFGTSVDGYDRIQNPQTIFGYKRSARFASPETIVKDDPATYSFPTDLLMNTWALEGSWTIGNEGSELVGDAGRFRLEYDAASVILAMDTTNRFEQFADVLLDGKPVPADMKGADLEIDATGRSFVRIEFPKPYALINGPKGSHLLELVFAKPHAKLTTVTFDAKAL